MVRTALSLACRRSSGDILRNKATKVLSAPEESTGFISFAISINLRVILNCSFISLPEPGGGHARSKPPDMLEQPNEYGGDGQQKDGHDNKRPRVVRAGDAAHVDAQKSCQKA